MWLIFTKYILHIRKIYGKIVVIKHIRSEAQ